MTLFIEIVYIFVTVVLILVVLLQAGRGGGLGTALGGGASQGVFGGGGGADFLAKLTQGLAAGFMICAVYLAYASAHTGSSRLQEASDDSQMQLFDEDEQVDYEQIGEGTPLPLPASADDSVVPTPQTAPDGGEAPNAEPAEGEPAEGEPELDMPELEGTHAMPPAETSMTESSDANSARDTNAKPAVGPATDAEAPTAAPKPPKPARKPADPATDAEAPTAMPEPTTPSTPPQGA